MMRFLRIPISVFVGGCFFVGCSNPGDYNVVQLTATQRAEVVKRLGKDNDNSLLAWERRNGGGNPNISVWEAITDQKQWEASQKIRNTQNAALEKEYLLHIEMAPKWNHAARLVFYSKLQALYPDKEEYRTRWLEERQAQDKIDAVSLKSGGAVAANKSEPLTITIAASANVLTPQSTPIDWKQASQTNKDSWVRTMVGAINAKNNHSFTIGEISSCVEAFYVSAPPNAWKITLREVTAVCFTMLER